MIVVYGLENVTLEWPSSVVTVGTYDGMHLGHQAVIGRAVTTAREEQIPAVAITFDRHPAATVRPGAVPPSLASIEDNLSQMRRLGLSAAFVLTFDEKLCACSAQQFLDTILVEKLKAAKVVVGHDFAFGHNREGNATWLASKIKTEVVPPVRVAGERISSSAIRKAIGEGGVEEAMELMGRPYSLEGVVVRGEQLGRTLGYPTANLALAQNRLVPADGVYGAIAFIDQRRYAAAVGIGKRPTVGGSLRTIEAYLLDAAGDFYGQALRLDFYRHLRTEQKFNSLETLKLKMGEDVDAVRRMHLLEHNEGHR